MKIIALEAENIKRIKAISIKPDGNMVVVGGDNGNGKTTTLDSIMYALAGKSDIPKEAVRRGEEMGVIRLDLGELKVTRTIKSDGSATLSVKGKDGGKHNQTTLNGLLGSISMDPVAFASEKPDAQAKILCRMLGVDFSGLDAKRKGLYDERTMVGREGKTLKGQLDGLVFHDDAPGEEVSMSDLIEKLNEANKGNERGRRLEQDMASLSKEQDQWAVAIFDLKEKMAETQEALNNAIRCNDIAKDAVEKKRVEINEFAFHDTDPIQVEIESLEATNAKVRENAKYKAAKEAVASKSEEWKSLTAQIEVIDADKAKQLSEAKMPIAGLSLDDGGLRYNGSQFSECSGAEKMRVSVAMAVAMNPKLRVFLVRDGSLMDAKSMALLSELASEHDAQVWVERVGDADEGAIIIEDGEIRQPVEAK